MAIGALIVSVKALAAPFDWVGTWRNFDDTQDSTYTMAKATTTKDAVIGTKPGSLAGNWYYFGKGFNINTASGVGAEDRQIDIDLGGWNPLDIGDLGDLLDAKMSISAYNALSSSTVAQIASNTFGIASIGGIVSQMIQNLYGTSTTMSVSAASTTSGLVSKSAWNSLVSQVNAISTSTVTWATLSGKPTFGAVATTSSYGDLTGKPLIGIAYEGTNQRTGAFPIFKNATVASGVATFNLTNDGLSTGTALFPNGIIADSIDVEVNDTAASYQMSYALSNGNKTLTVTANKLTTSNILTGILGQAQANGTVIRMTAWGY